MSTYALDLIAAQLPDALAERPSDRTGAEWGVVRPASIRDVARLAKDIEFRLFISMDAVDRLHLEQSSPRFEVVYFFASTDRAETLRLKVRVNEDTPSVPSIHDIFQGANWAERFIWDFYGIRFSGHPDLRRLLMYEEFEGHPLRKDYPLRGRQPLVPERPLRDVFRGPGTNGTAP